MIQRNHLSGARLGVNKICVECLTQGGAAGGQGCDAHRHQRRTAEGD